MSECPRCVALAAEVRRLRAALEVLSELHYLRPADALLAKCALER